MSEASPPVPSPARRFLGRDREREAIDRLLDGVRGGRGGVLVVHGEAGVGKTALLEYAVEAGARVSGRPDVRGRGGDGAAVRGGSAAVLPDPRAHGSVSRRPSATRSASRSASVRGPRRIRSWSDWRSSACCPRLRRSEPLLCVVDDAQWLDRASARALAFVARRLLAEKIALVFAAREPSDVLAGLPELHVLSLGHRDARTLLESALPARLDEHVLDRIVVETRGNPLALLELPRGLTPTQLAGGFGLPAAVPLSASIEESFTRQAGQPSARRAAPVARGGGGSSRRYGARVAGGAAARNPRVGRGNRRSAKGLLELGARVVFRHPLVRSAVYRAAGLKERRAVHRALAEATDPQIDPDRRAWHRAQATSMPDEDVAAELERSAGRAQARGGLAAVAAFLERAAALTPESTHRAQRLLAAAGAKRDAGDLEGALGLLEGVEAGVLDELGRRAGRSPASPDRVGAAARRRRRPPVSERREPPRATRPRAGPRDLPRGARGRHGQRR